ncbi:hypothetical protein H8D04_00590 [bacterium]|nr:hypothetical protein [bacterium]
MKITKSQLRELIREELENLNEGKQIFKKKMSGLEKNVIRLDEEPHSDENLYGIRVNGDFVAIITIGHDGTITTTRHKKNIKLK